jgi:leucyl-tRNA synthetase
VYKHKKIGKKQAQTFLQLLNPIAPHLTEEINQIMLKNNTQLVFSTWPLYDPIYLKQLQVKIIFQVNSKLRSVLELPCNLSSEQIKNIALKDTKVNKFVCNKNIKNIIYIPNKLLNIIVD